jgi:uncharacterized protein GlcG (DUF336 family)
MKRIVLAAALAVAASPVWAQAPQSAPQPPRPIGGPPLSLAMEAAEAAIAACKANGYGVVATVVDEIGLTKLAIAPDGAPGPGSNGGRRKAVMAVTFGADSGAIVDQMKTDAALAEKINADKVNFFPARGAVLIRAGGKVIGALGIGGAPGGDKDEACAKAGLGKIQARLDAMK